MVTIKLNMMSDICRTKICRPYEALIFYLAFQRLTPLAIFFRPLMGWEFTGNTEGAGVGPRQPSVFNDNHSKSIPINSSALKGTGVFSALKTSFSWVKLLL